MTDASRRDVLRLGLGISLAGAAGLAGCTLSNPAVDQPTGRPTATSSGTPTPTTGTSSASPPAVAANRRSGTESELHLSLLAQIIASVRKKDLTSRQRSFLKTVAAAHDVHATFLSDYRPTMPAPSARGALKGVLADLAQAERAAARRYRSNALATSGADALLWASLSVAAQGFATAIPDTEPRRLSTPHPPKTTAILSDTAATQDMVGQLHAMIYGYQLAIGKLPVLSKDHGRAVDQLLATRKLRDRLIAWLIRRGADVPAAQAAYVPSVNPSSPAKAGQLIMKMNVALQPFCGLMIAAANDRDRVRAFDTLSGTVATARGWGAPLTAWPGYPSS